MPCKGFNRQTKKSFFFLSICVLTRVNGQLRATSVLIKYFEKIKRATREMFIFLYRKFLDAQELGVFDLGAWRRDGSPGIYRL